jgi:hypothetical protein
MLSVLPSSQGKHSLCDITVNFTTTLCPCKPRFKVDFLFADLFSVSHLPDLSPNSRKSKWQKKVAHPGKYFFLNLAQVCWGPGKSVAQHTDS